MRINVIQPPQPVVDPDEIPAGHGMTDEAMAGIIAAAQAMIDGPSGWVGRAFGIQTLELVANRFSCRADGVLHLPYWPVLEVEAVEYLDTDGAIVAVPATDYRLSMQGGIVRVGGSSWPSTEFVEDAVRIRYLAGYAKRNDGAWIGDPPAPVKAAVMLMTRNLLAGFAAEGGLRSYEVQGAFTEQYNSPELVARARTSTVDALLQPFRVYS